MLTFADIETSLDAETLGRLTETLEQIATFDQPVPAMSGDETLDDMRPVAEGMLSAEAIDFGDPWTEPLVLAWGAMGELPLTSEDAAELLVLSGAGLGEAGVDAVAPVAEPPVVEPPAVEGEVPNPEPTAKPSATLPQAQNQEVVSQAQAPLSGGSPPNVGVIALRFDGSERSQRVVRDFVRLHGQFVTEVVFAEAGGDRRVWSRYGEVRPALGALLDADHEE
ncbi:hypothetical protein [Stratiformator vulcanicus]|uniref:Uncharacterized protein n=1 Tax=Stratiformator vulcanicus TaxID=2527980 RepID=A0A517R7A9_9PLAN|nr:hypothetical protein [Stratiformator vulcanicus]QDT39742.1 hypothetical protein Pan189_41510 [Stratiformator vulcanicus]